MQKTHSLSSSLPAAIMIAAVCFNAVFAIINGHVMGLGRGQVAFAEIVIYAAALAVVVFNADRRMWPWFLLTLFIILSGLLIGLGNGEFNPKYTRDVLVIPIFIMLGMTYRADSFVKPFLVLHTIVFVVTAVEIIIPNTYAEIFKIVEYYVNTRDFSANSFWNTESSLFVSATRPGARFFSFVDWHRASSIFLEPVSLGNYCVVAGTLIAAYWRDMSIPIRSYAIASTFFLLVACDGRLATTSIAAILFALIFVRHISSRWSIVYLPIVLVLSAGYVWALGLTEVTDNFAGRVTGTVDALSRLDVSALLGLKAAAAEDAADNGIVYFILSQSLIGVAVIWIFICLLAPDVTPPSRIYVHAIAMFVPLNLLVSNSFFSIKVASLMWFVYGYFYMSDLATEPGLSGRRQLPIPASSEALFRLNRTS